MITYKGLVMANETDSNNHMNVQFYTRKFDEATGVLFAELGLEYKQLTQRNLGMAYVEVNIQYKREVVEDEALHIASSIKEIARKVITIKHELYNTSKKEISSVALVKLVFFDMEKRKAVELPTEIIELLKPHLKKD